MQPYISASPFVNAFRKPEVQNQDLIAQIIKQKNNTWLQFHNSFFVSLEHLNTICAEQSSLLSSTLLKSIFMIHGVILN